MKIKNLLSIGIIIFLFIILTGCPMECVAPHEIRQDITILPQNDTIHIGDTLKFSTSFETSYTDGSETVDISDREVNITCDIFIYDNENPFFDDFTGLENFEFIVKKGTIKNSDIILCGGEVPCREFFYELNSGKFEAELEIVAKDTGNYILKLYSTENNVNAGGRDCEQNFEVTYNFDITDEHKLNNILIENSGYKEDTYRNSFYAFVVVE